jgi:CheY-like chemotaxis protein
MSRVLIVDDYDDTRDLIRFLLEMYGYEVAEAKNGIEAIESVQRQVPDLVLMDISMPGMDGLTAAIALREDPVTAGIPVVLLTASVLAAERAALAELRAAPPTCRRDGIEELAVAALVDAGQLARLVDGAATIESVFAEVRALHAKNDPGARAAYDAAVSLAALAGTDVVTWIPEAPNRPPIVSPDGKRWLAVQSQRVAVHDVETGLAIFVKVHR